MKKILYGTAVAVLAMFSACEMLEPLDEELDMAVSGASGASPQVIFTATLGLDSKTTLKYDGEAYKTVWTDNDIIYVIDPDTGTTEACSIVDGMGTKTATFAGTLQADSYIAVYGNNVRRRTDGSISLSLSSWQSFYGSFSLGSFPMVAQSDSKSFSFKNLCSVLNLRVTGNGENLTSIKISSNDSEVPVYGDALIDLSGEEPSLDLVAHNEGEDEFLYVGTWTELNAEPSDIYIVLPAQTYPGGFTLTLGTDDNEEKSFVVTDDVEMRRSRIRNLNLSYSEGLSAKNNLVIEMTTDDGTSWSVTEYMEYRDGWYVMENLNLSYREQFRIYNTDTGDYYGCSGDYGNSRGKTNTKVNLGYGSEWWWMWADAAGVYDIYLDLENEFIYMMSNGYTPESLPTDEHVLYDYAEDIAYYASDGELVKVSGIVLAKCGNGFIVAMNGYMRNNIYVYDPRGVYPVELGNVVDLYAEVYEYRGLKELVIPSTVSPWYHILDSSEYDYIPESPRVISDLSSFSSLTFDYISYVGTLEISGSYYNVKVDGQTGYKGSISSPIMDLTPYNGKKVLVEGYYIGNSTSGSTTYLNVMMKRITLVTDENSGGSSTEDITPGESFPVTRRSLDIE